MIKKINAIVLGFIVFGMVSAIKAEAISKDVKPAPAKKSVKKAAKSKKTAAKQMWICPECRMTSDKAGKCSMCGVEMKKM